MIRQSISFVLLVVATMTLAEAAESNEHFVEYILICVVSIVAQLLLAVLWEGSATYKGAKSVEENRSGCNAS